MAADSVSTLVLFIAALSVAAAVSGTLVSSVGGLADAVGAHGADVAEDIDTDIEIISDPASGAVYDATDETVSLLVKNSGRRHISTSGPSIEVLLDGEYVMSSAITVTVLDGESWTSGTVVRIVIDSALATGDHSATVIVESERETIRFRT
ncbi:MAG: fla cluster protein flaG [Halobacteriales archaeon]|nr:fla cluster protein flaG [Halobacteriales archaeon]